MYFVYHAIFEKFSTVFAITIETRWYVLTNCSYQNLDWELKIFLKEKKPVSVKSIHDPEDSFSNKI